MSAAQPPSFSLRERDGRTELVAHHRSGYGAISADWLGAELQRRIAAGRRQPLARAVGLHKQKAITLLDATAGLGRDGFTLAALGATVTLAERNPLIVALLRDAQRQASSSPARSETAARVEIIETDAHELLQGVRHWDAIYLDPMYPDDGKTALPSKEMQILRDLNGGDPDADALLPLALDRARQRVVVKRPSHAPWLAGREPSLSLRTRQLRLDVYLRTA